MQYFSVIMVLLITFFPILETRTFDIDTESFPRTILYFDLCVIFTKNSKLNNMLSAYFFRSL
jgi:hypothetical protein